jgi:hypothetical protein
MATGNAVPGGRQRMITGLFRFKKPKANERSTQATGEPAPPTLLQSSKPTVTDNDKSMIPQRQQGSVTQEVVILMSSPRKTSPLTPRQMTQPLLRLR